MNREQITEELEKLEYPDGRSLSRKGLSYLKEAIISQTEFLDEEKKATLSFRVHCILNNITEIPSCSMCGENVTITQNTNEKSSKYEVFVFGTYCSSSCQRADPSRADKAMVTMIERYGDHNMKTDKGKKKQQDSLERKWGVRNPIHHPDIAKRSLIDPTTGLYRIQSEDFKNKSEETRKKNWENGNHMRDPSFMENFKRSNIEKWGVPNYTQRHINSDTINILDDKEKLQELLDRCVYMKFAAIELGVHQSSIQRACARVGVKVNQRHKSSIAEIEIHSFISQYCSDAEMSSRSVLPSGSEIDIYVPSKKVGIEFNGVYWHSEKFRDKKYHQEKSLESMSQEIQLIHIWEDDWKDPIKKEILKNKILSKLGVPVGSVIYARKTNVSLIPSEKAHVFMNCNHIQGKTTASQWIGLTDERGELVSCMGIKKIDSNGSWDLVRYATSTTVVGGFSKCLKFFKRNYEWSDIITYAALDYSHGGVYEKSGFESEGVTVPGMWYVKGDKRFRREQFMKHKLKDRLEEFDPTLTERENMTNHGFLRLYDSGSIKYRMINGYLP